MVTKKFLEAFRENFWLSTKAFLIMALAGCVIALDYWFWMAAP